jgi:hypothetical protein
MAENQTYVDDLLNEWAPPETFELEIAPGKPWKFRSITDYSEWIKVHTKAAAFARIVKDKQYPAEWEPVIPTTQESAVKVHLIHQALVSPALELVDVMKVAKRFGSAFYALVDAYATMTTYQRQSAEVEAVTEGKDSTPSPSTAD